MLERLHKILARAGVAALRPAEDMILEGRVSVNGRVVRELGARADADVDVIAVDGTPIDVPQPSEPHQYIMLHKPVGVISTAHDTHGRPTVVDLVPNGVRVFPVGRLDADSEGLLLLTDDGDLAYRLTHPRFEIDKEYRVLVDHTPQLSDLRRWRNGVELDGEMTAPAWVEVLDRDDDGTWLRVVMREGRKRQIREVARLLGMHVRRLIRVREGSLALADLAPGAWRALTQAEVESLRTHTQHVPSREADEERERTMSEEGNRRRRLRIIRRPARGEAASNQSLHQSTSEPADDGAMFQAESIADLELDHNEDPANVPTYQAQSTQPRRGRFDGGAPSEQGPRGEAGSRGGQDRDRDNDGNRRSPNRDHGGRDRAPNGGRDNRAQGRYDARSERPNDRRRDTPYNNDRGRSDRGERPAYGNDRNRAPYDNSRDRGGPSYGGSRDRGGPSYGGSRDRGGPSYGGSRDRDRAPYGDSRERRGPRDERAPYGGSRDRSGPPYGGSRDRSGPPYGGSRDRDRSGPMYGGSRDRNEPGQRRPSYGNSREGSRYGNDRRPSGNRDNQSSYQDNRGNNRSARPSFDRDRRGPTGNDRSTGQRRSFEGGQRQGPSGERGFGRAPRAPQDRGFGRAPGGDRDQRGGFNTRGQRDGNTYDQRPQRDGGRSFERRPADGGGRRDATGNRPERGNFSPGRAPRAGGRPERRSFGGSPSQGRFAGGDRPRRDSDARFERPRDDEE